MSDEIKVRRATAAAWAAANPVLADGEIGLEKDTRLLRFGDGVTAWNDLPALSGGDSGSVLTLAEDLATDPVNAAPTAFGPVTTAGGYVGDGEVRIADGPVTIGAGWTPANWFSSVQDTVSAWVVVRGNLTIDAGQTFIPPVRKLFTVVYVDGNLTLNGAISMTARGANHSGVGTSGGRTAPREIVVHPDAGLVIPAYGGAGAQSQRTADADPGGAGSPGAGACGGGGGGGCSYHWTYGGNDYGPSVGARGTCFSGGPGGAGGRNTPMFGLDAGQEWGGAGGVSSGDGNGMRSGNGAGNPSSASTYGNAGGSGTGGTLIVIVTGALTGTGTFESRGSAGGVTSASGGSHLSSGGGSGGGCVVAMVGSGSRTINVQGGLGGNAYDGNGRPGGPGGHGTGILVPFPA